MRGYFKLTAMSRSLPKKLHGCISIAVSIIAVLAGTCAATAQAPAAGTDQNTNAAQTPFVLAIFDSKIDTKSVKAGDPVTAKITKDLKLNELKISKSSRLLGTVTSAQSMQDGNGTSSLAIKFDRIEMKDNKVLPIQGLIVAIGPAPKYQTGLGYDSVMSRGGFGPNSDNDPSIAADKYSKDPKELPKGSTLEGVALALNFDPDGATVMRGVHRDVKVNSDVMIRVALFRGK